MWTTKDIPSQKGRTVIVTGGNTGIGFETALALYQAGANVIIACRSANEKEYLPEERIFFIKSSK